MQPCPPFHKYRDMAYIILFLILAAPQAWGSDCVSDNTLQKRMVLIEKYSRGKGSGVLYGGTTVITNRHVVEDVEIPWVWVPALQKSIRADVIYQAGPKEADLAILKLRERVPSTSILPLASGTTVDETLRVSGFPFGEKHKLSTTAGTFKKRAKTPDMATPDLMLTLLSSDQTFSGDSGGGIFNCAGKLAGIHFGNQAHIGKPRNSYGVHVSTLKRILQKLSIPTVD